MKVDTQQIDQVMSLMTPERLSRLNAVQRRELDQLVKHLETSVVREKGQEKVASSNREIHHAYIENYVVYTKEVTI